MPTDLKFGLARMWQAYAKELISNTHVVRSRDDAEKIISSITNLITLSDDNTYL